MRCPLRISSCTRIIRSDCADVLRRGANQPACASLLTHMRAPSRRTSDGKSGSELNTCEPTSVEQDRGEEFDVRSERTIWFSAAQDVRRGGLDRARESKA